MMRQSDQWNFFTVRFFFVKEIVSGETRLCLCREARTREATLIVSPWERLRIKAQNRVKAKVLDPRVVGSFDLRKVLDDRRLLFK